MTSSSDERSTTKSDMFSRVSTSRVSQVIVDQVKLLLRDGSLRPGDRLPSERDLCEQFGVSRVTIREALRVLESSGLVSIKVGARGGAFVTTPTTERLGEGLADLLSLSHLTASDVTEARKVVESGALPLIVDRATDDDIADLLQLIDDGQKALTKGEYDVAMSAAFHVRLAECAHNPALTALIHSFHGPMLMSLREAKVSAPLMGPQGHEEHRAIVVAIQSRDVAEAGRIMNAHLSRTASRVASL
jgi:GntR family transcriptional repressor for pyruvate dehydrogenase complex